MNNKELIIELARLVKEGKKTWKEQADTFNKETGLDISGEALRKKYSRVKEDKPFTEKIENKNEYTTIYQNGLVEAQIIVNLTPEQKQNPSEMLKAVGYNPNEWDLVQLTFSNWQTHTKEQETKELYAVKFRIKPKIKTEIDLKEAIGVAKELFGQDIKPLKINTTPKNKELNDNKLLEQPGIELHLGEMSCHIDTGENYDHKIAQERFKQIVEKTVEKQEYEKCGTLLLGIGNDFFNSDNPSDTTTKGTPQHSDTRWKKLFLLGLKMYIEAVKTYIEHFNTIDIQLVPGNHDLSTSFYLYVALEQAFKECEKVNFINDYKEVQCYVFGDCGIWSTHGTKNVNRTMDSIVSEFSKEYGETRFRELHFNHLHNEQELKERLGIIPRRLSSPKGRGEWEYNERYGTVIQKQQLFIWEKGKGLTDIAMIPFEQVLDNDKKKLMIRK